MIQKVDHETLLLLAYTDADYSINSTEFGARIPVSSKITMDDAPTSDNFMVLADVEGSRSINIRKPSV